MPAVTARRGRVGFLAALVAGLVIVAWAAGRPPQDGDPLDPRSSGELGARGLVLFLEEMGAEVTVSSSGPTSATDVTLLLDDGLSAATRDRLADWVAAGGTLVVVDPFSPLSAPLADGSGGLGDLLGGDLGRGECDIAALVDVEDVDAPGAARYTVGPDAGSCFGDGESAYVVTGVVGDGTVVSIGSPTVLLNDSLDEHDHAVLAGALLAPEPGTRVTILEPAPPGTGDETLGDLVSGGVKAALVQLCIAFLVYALFRARRLGRPVAEPLPVTIAGSELVVAVGHLLHQAGDPDRAASVLREDARRALARRLDLPIDASVDLVAEAAAAHATVDRDRLHDLLTASPVSDERELVELAQALDHVRQEILHGQPV